MRGKCEETCGVRRGEVEEGMGGITGLNVNLNNGFSKESRVSLRLVADLA